MIFAGMLMHVWLKSWQEEKKTSRGVIIMTQVKNTDVFIKKLLLAWDPDFTKVTPEERNRLDKADEEMKRGEYFTDDEVWK